MADLVHTHHLTPALLDNAAHACVMYGWKHRLDGFFFCAAASFTDAATLYGSARNYTKAIELEALAAETLALGRAQSAAEGEALVAEMLA